MSTISPAKRKREHGTLAAAKKQRRSTMAINMGSNTEFKSMVEKLKDEIVMSISNINKVRVLIELLNEPDIANRCTVMAVLCQLFYRFMGDGTMSGLHSSSEKDMLVSEWLYKQLEEFSGFLLQCIKDTNGVLCTRALDSRMLLLEAELITVSSSDGIFRMENTLQKVITLILNSRNVELASEHFIKAYGSRYFDVRHFTYLGLRHLSTQKSRSDFLDGIIVFLTKLESTSVHNPHPGYFSSHTQLISRQFHSFKQRGATWLAVLNGDLNKLQRKSLLGLIPHHIAPFIDRLELLSDFLDDSFHVGGSISLMALSGLFQLIQEKNLDYPDFFRKLYSLTGPATIHSKHRTRFFRLLQTFLSSTHLPASLVASFAKRLSRLALFSSPPAIVVIVPLVYNLLKAHPSCTFMLHRARKWLDVRGSLEGCTINDPFRAAEEDPIRTSAIESSLWELETLQTHYHPNVATICQILSQQFTKQEYNMEDFLDHSYASMVGSDLIKDLKKPPVVEFSIPQTIFPKLDENFQSGIGRLWNFNP